jgi:hypothetical protein
MLNVDLLISFYSTPYKCSNVFKNLIRGRVTSPESFIIGALWVSTPTIFLMSPPPEVIELGWSWIRNLASNFCTQSRPVFSFDFLSRPVFCYPPLIFCKGSLPKSLVVLIRTICWCHGIPSQIACSGAFGRHDRKYAP